MSLSTAAASTAASTATSTHCPPAKRVVIVGGVAGGASVATRLRRLDDTAEITVFERGPYVSYANCGLPYRCGNVIGDDSALMLVTPKLFLDRFGIDVRVNTEVVAVDHVAKTVAVRDLDANTTSVAPYDTLVLATGARAVRPPVPGADLPGIFVVKTIPDIQKIRAWIDALPAVASGVSHRAVVVGGGFIGIEMAENLHRLGLHVSVVEKAPQLMTMLDVDLARVLEQRLREEKVDVILGDGLTQFTASDAAKVTVHTETGLALPADLVIIALGAAPENTLAKQAGLALHARTGAVEVDGHMRTSDAHIYAVGDMVATKSVVTGLVGNLPLAGPAQRQARVAAEAIAGVPVAKEFRGVQGTAVCGAFGAEMASTGANERALKQAGNIPFQVVRLHPNQHVSYYPDSHPIHLKLFFRPDTGAILGAQAIGVEAVARRIDVISAFMQMNATVFDLAEAELCYAPQFGSAKDPVNFAGMIASHVVQGTVTLADWDSVLDGTTTSVLLDVRTPREFANGHLPNAINIPLDSLRERLGELPRDKRLISICAVGQRAYNATCILKQHGFEADLLSGGMTTYQCLRGEVRDWKK